MSKICGYSCEHNKSGVCQISVCDKRTIMSDKTEAQMFTRYIDTTITKLQQENKQLKDNWNKLKEYLHNQIPTDKTVLTKHIKIFELLDKMQEIEQGSDSNVKY
jgi:hypothetical protein|nr:MAG TPA: hypothetical protein [Caudoviricetes sp.]